MVKYSKELILSLNNDLKNYFPHLKIIQKNFTKTLSSISRMVMLDRYAQKDDQLKTLKVNDLVIVIIKNDITFPTRGIGYVLEIGKQIVVQIEKQYVAAIDVNLLQDQKIKDIVIVNKNQIQKPLELFYEQIALRVSGAIAKDEDIQIQRDLYEEIVNFNIVPAGRVLYGAGSKNNVTLFNCFVLPFIKDSRAGIAKHRKETMEIMSRGGGVGTNGSTLRPKGAVAQKVGGHSSGAVSWLNDLSTLTHLVQQGGSRRGAQMIMLADWHPDVIEFIVSKMLNWKILKWLLDNSEDKLIRQQARNKLTYCPLDDEEIKLYELLRKNNFLESSLFKKLEQKIKNNGSYKVNNKNFLTGANISVTISDKFMKAVALNQDWDLKFPDIENYNQEEKEYYDKHWHEVGDVYLWEKMGYKIKTYYTLKAQTLWDLINFCANYSAEPGIFFIDQASRLTNANAYGMKIVATNPCAEQPLTAYAVCNLSAINLANFVNKETQKILWQKLITTVKRCVRFQDNVIDKSFYFLKENKHQALSERRIGLGVMGLHDLLIWNNTKYGSEKSLKVIDQIFQTICLSAYQESIQLAKEKGSFPYLTFANRKKLVNSGFVKTLPTKIKNQILKYGLRNSHLLTVAPTGSTGTMVNVSTGLEPYFAFKYFRSGQLGKNMFVSVKILDEWLQIHPEYKNKKLPDIFVSAMDLTPLEHVKVQCVIQRWIDSSISKTVNAPKGYTVRQVQKIYEELYHNGAKGGTVYVDGSRDAQVLSLEDVPTSSKQLEFKNLMIDSKIKIKNKFRFNEFRGIKIDRKWGTNIGDLCPICKEGSIIFSGGCSTCNNCHSQLKCGY